MDRKSMEQLKLDKRLTRRRGWISKEEFERHLESLPDLAHKVAEVEPEGSEAPEPQPGS